MPSDYRTCTHLHDDGRLCQSAAVTNQHFCGFHLDHRARLMRIARSRARADRWQFQMPPLDDMRAVNSALNHLGQAIAADMIDLKRADRLLAVLRLASRNLLRADKWPASPYHAQEPAPAIDLAAQYGLPPGTDLSIPPESVFPPPQPEEPAPPATGDRQPPPDGYSDLFDPAYMVSPETLEIANIYTTVSPEAATVRMRQLERNRQRRELTASRKRFEREALRLNIRNAAERLARKKLAEREARHDAPKKPPMPTEPENSASTAENAVLTPTG